MVFKILNDDKNFLLEEYKSKFEKLYSSDTIVIPEHWDEYFITQKHVRRDEISEWKLMMKFLLCDIKTVMSCFFDSEIPRSIQQSCQMLLRKSNNTQQFTFKDKAFEKKHFAVLGAYDVISSPFYIRQKFKDIDALLRTDFNKKLFFVFEKRTNYPYQIADVAQYHFFVKDKDIEYYSETEDYVIADINKINDKDFFNDFVLNGYRYSSMLRLNEIATSIKNENYLPEVDTYVLGGGAISLFQSLYPQLPLIHFGHKEWDNSKILIVEEKDNIIYKSNRVNYADYLMNCFFTNINFNNAGYICNNEEFSKYKIKLIIKYSYQLDHISLNQKEISEILNQ